MCQADVVEMRRYDERRTMVSLPERGELNLGQVQEVAPWRFALTVRSSGWSVTWTRCSTGA